MIGLGLGLGLRPNTPGSSTLAADVQALWFLFGQSGMDGQYSLSEATEQGRWSQIQVPNRDAGAGDLGALVDLVIVKDSNTVGSDTGPISTGSESPVSYSGTVARWGVGPEMGFAEAAGAGSLYDGRDVILLKWANDGQSIGRMHPIDGLDDGGSGYDNITFREWATYVWPQIDTLVGAGARLAPQAILMHQGEKDAADNNDAVYPGWLDGLRTYLRQRLGDPTLPFICCELKEASTDLQDMNAALKSCCAYEVTGSSDGSTISLAALTGDDTYRDSNSYFIDLLSASALAAMEGTPSDPWGPNADVHPGGPAEEYIGRTALGIIRERHATHADGLRGTTIITKTYPTVVMKPEVTTTNTDGFAFQLKCSEAGTFYWAKFAGSSGSSDKAAIAAGTGAVDFGTTAVIDREALQTFDTFTTDSGEASTEYTVSGYFVRASDSEETPVVNTTATTAAAFNVIGTESASLDTAFSTTVSALANFTKPAGAGYLVVGIPISAGHTVSAASWDSSSLTAVSGAAVAPASRPTLSLWYLDVSGKANGTAAALSVTKSNAAGDGVALAWWIPAAEAPANWGVATYTSNTTAETDAVVEITPDSTDGLILVAGTQKDDVKTGGWTATGGVAIEETVDVDGSNVNYMRAFSASKVNSSSGAQTVGATNTDTDTVNAIALHIKAAA